jgi:hypothetical protein
MKWKEKCVNTLEENLKLQNMALKVEREDMKWINLAQDTQ